MADLSLKIAVKLLTKNFHNGVNSLKGSIRSLQMQFFALSSALGAGTIGFTNLISRMRETAKETSAVNIALKNVSGSTAAFAENQKWLLSVAGKYGIQINTLTSGFTKFKAAADIANMSAEDQRKIFESVSRASVAFNLSAEDQKGVFTALAQMMSKGKVMAEELRLQMAERLPVAIQAMAKAAGVSVDKLDAMMKQGKVLSSDVLPKFAKVLTEMTSNVDLDNINKSLADFHNNFLRVVKSFDVEGKYKAIVDTLGGALSWVADRAKAVGNVIAGALAFGFGRTALKGLGLLTNEQEKATANAIKLMRDEERAKEVFFKKLDALNKARVQSEIAAEEQAALAVDASEKKKVAAANRTAKARTALSKAAAEFEIANQNLISKNALVTDKVRQQAALRNAGMFAKAWNGVGIAIKKAWSGLKALASATIWSAIIAGAVAVLAKLVQIVAQTVKIRNSVKATRKALAEPIDISSQEQSARSNYDILANKSKKYTVEQQKGALSALNSALGTEYEWNSKISDKLDEINAKKERYIKYLRAQKQLEQAQGVAADARKELEAYIGDYYESAKKNNQLQYGWMSKEQYIEWNLEDPAKRLSGNARKLLQSFESANRDVQHWTGQLAKYSTEFERSFDTSTSGGGGAGTPEVAGEETALQKAQKDYADALAELEAELGAQLITEREYTSKKRDLIEKSYINALSGGDADTLASPWFGNLQKEFGSFAHGQLRKRQEAVEDMLAEYHDNLQALNRQKENQVIAEEEYSDSVRQLAMSFAREAGALDLSDLPQQLVEAVAKEIKGAAIKALQNTKPYQPIERDHRTWEMTESDIAAENLAEAENYLAYLREQALATGRDMVDEINAQLDKVNSLKDALKLADAKDAIEELSRELREGSWSGVRSAVSNLDGIVSAVERVNDVMEDTDASGWEQLMAVWEAMASMVDGIMEMISVIETLQKVSDALTKAEMANSGKKVVANTAESASEAGKTAAKSPLPLGAKIAAIAGAVAAVIGIFASLPKFAKGGVVGGASTSGDKVLARLNSGEGVLTQRGMTNLAGLAESKASNVRVTGTLKARGRDLIVALDNEKRYQRRIK